MEFKSPDETRIFEYSQSEANVTLYRSVSDDVSTTILSGMRLRWRYGDNGAPRVTSSLMLGMNGLSAGTNAPDFLAGGNIVISRLHDGATTSAMSFFRTLSVP